MVHCRLKSIHAINVYRNSKARELEESNGQILVFFSFEKGNERMEKDASSRYEPIIIAYVIWTTVRNFSHLKSISRSLNYRDRICGPVRSYKHIVRHTCIQPNA